MVSPLWLRILEHHRLNREKNSWLHQRSIEEMLAELEKEAEEVKRALKGEGDVADEIADLLRDVLNIIALAHRKGIREEEILQRFLEKDVRRKPWLYWPERLSPQQQLALWQEAKGREK